VRAKPVVMECAYCKKDILETKFFNYGGHPLHLDCHDKIQKQNDKIKFYKDPDLFDDNEEW
jgi:hypothetical protein